MSNNVELRPRLSREADQPVIIVITKNLSASKYMAPEHGKRVVKLGRKLMGYGPIVHHWAIKVGDLWYEIAGLNMNSADVLNANLDSNTADYSNHFKRVAKSTRVNTSAGSHAISGAGKYGGEIVGMTTKTGEEIDEWIAKWIRDDPRYHLLWKNCHKFAYEFMVWLTDGVYRCEHTTNSTGSDNFANFFDFDGFATKQDGNAIASFSVGQGRLRRGFFEVKLQVGQVNAQAVCGPGLGLFLDTTVAEAKLSAGNIIGARVGLNGNTGVGIRNGNLEAHVFGFGGKIGADGIEVNSPFVGVHFCSVM